MKGFLTKQKINLAENANNDIIGNVVGSLKFGASILRDTVGKAVPINKLETEFFATKKGVLYWQPHERSRKSTGSIIIRDIEAIEINQKNPLEIQILLDNKLYKLQSSESKYNAEKWYNSIKMIKDMGDL